MEMLLPVPLVLSLGSLVRGPGRKLAAAAAAVMAVTIFLSGSRGGMAAFTVQIAVLAAVLVRRRKKRATALAFGIFLAAVAISAGWIGGAHLSSRLASIQSETQSELSQGTRLAIVRDGLKMFRDRPLLGWGLGTFPDVYPRYRSFYTNFFVNQAHDDFLQLLVETGALGFAVMLWFLTVTISRGARKLGNWPADPNGSLSLVGVLACTGILAHSLVDFNLQIPANAAWFYVLCILTAMEPRFALLPFRKRSGQGARERRQETDR
jgi:O-antigen ligase